MRVIEEIIIHCSATPEGRDYDAATIRKWHLQRGFSDIGYHYIVRLDGSIELGRPLSNPGAHCSGHNKNSIGICYVGGVDKNNKPKDTRTEAQKRSLRSLVNTFRTIYPKATLHGHREFAAKACPCFDVKDLL